jgi:hypothetical protein
MALANESNSIAICIIDLKNRDYIWADTELERGLPVLENTTEANGELLRSLILGGKMSVYDLVKIHADARGKIVANRDDADVKIDWDELVTDYTKVGEYMNI